MKLASVKEFHDQATSVLHSKDTIVITRHGKIAGYFLPHKTKKLPPDVRWKLFDEATLHLRERLRKQGVTEKQILEDFERWRRRHRISRHRR